MEIVETVNGPFPNLEMLDNNQLVTL